jgi:hypothetical protein
MSADSENSGRSILKNLKKNNRKKVFGLGPLSSVLVTLGIYFGSQIIAGVLVLQYLFTMGSKKEDAASLVDGSVLLQFSFILIAEFASLALLWLFLKRRKISLARIGIKRPARKNFLYALPAYAMYFAGILVVFGLITAFVPGIDTDQKQQIGFATASGLGPLLLVFMALVALPAVVEEILVRGFLYSGLKSKLPVIKAALLTSVIFAVAHLQLGSGAGPVWIAAIDTFILSVVLIWLREKTGNIWAGVAVHMMKNSLAFLSLFVFKIF